MAITTTVITATIKDLVEAFPAGSVATLYVVNKEPFKHGNEIIGVFEKTASFNSSGVATITVIETATPGQKLEFFIAITEGKSKRLIYFDDAVIPNTATQNLTDFTTPRRSAF